MHDAHFCVRSDRTSIIGEDQGLYAGEVVHCQDRIPRTCFQGQVDRTDGNDTRVSCCLDGDVVGIRGQGNDSRHGGERYACEIRAAIHDDVNGRRVRRQVANAQAGRRVDVAQLGRTAARQGNQRNRRPKHCRRVSARQSRHREIVAIRERNRTRVVDDRSGIAGRRYANLIVAGGYFYRPEGLFESKRPNRCLACQVRVRRSDKNVYCGSDGSTVKHEQPRITRAHRSNRLTDDDRLDVGNVIDGRNRIDRVGLEA